MERNKNDPQTAGYTDLALGGAEAIDNTPPAHPTLGCRLELLPAVTASQHVCRGVSAPSVNGSSFLFPCGFKVRDCLVLLLGGFLRV